jgi:hypothetical protein
VETTAGHRYFGYAPTDVDTLGSGEYIYFGLGQPITVGNRHTISRDTAADIVAAQPDVTLLEVNEFLIRGSGMVGDIRLQTK